MTHPFFRIQTDKSEQPMPLDGVCAGPTPTACWLVGGGPSLSRMPLEAIRSSPLPKMCVNLSGARLLRPNLWTSYDPSARFHRSVYLDASVMKFVHRRRAMDLVPETTFKVCECPNTFFFERDAERDFANFLSPNHVGIVDWADSMVQAIDILYRLGFRRLYLIGCEMRIVPGRAWLRGARNVGVEYEPTKLLREFYRACRDAGISEDEIERWGSAAQYHFDERKPVRAALNTDGHYFRIAQLLRLCRKSLATAGMQIISATPRSRLNDYFPSMTAARVCRTMLQEVGDPQAEPTRGLYTQAANRQPELIGVMCDFPPPKRPSKPHEVSPNRGNRAEPVDGEMLVEMEGYQRVQREWAERDGQRGNGAPQNGRPLAADEIDENG